MIICPRCNAKNNDGDTVCPFCDANLAPAAKAATAAAGAVIQNPFGPVTPPIVNPTHQTSPVLPVQPAVPPIEPGRQDAQRETIQKLPETVKKVEEVAGEVIAEAKKIENKLPPTTRRWMLTTLGAVLASGGASGYSGFRMARNNSPEKLGQQNLAAKLQEEQKLSNGLRDNIEKLNAEIKAKEAENERLNKKSSTISGQSASLQTQLQQNQQKLKKAEGEVTGLQQQLNTERHRAKFGMLEWSGTLDKKGESLLVELKNGRPHKGSMQGSLPGVPCTVWAGDAASVAVVESPNQQDPNHLTFRVTGKGKTTVRLFWGVS